MFAMVPPPAPAQYLPALPSGALIPGPHGVGVVDTLTLFLRDPWPVSRSGAPHYMLPWTPDRADRGPPQEKRGGAKGNQGQKGTSPKT